MGGLFKPGPIKPPVIDEPLYETLKFYPPANWKKVGGEIILSSELSELIKDNISKLKNFQRFNRWDDYTPFWNSQYILYPKEIIFEQDLVLPNFYGYRINYRDCYEGEKWNCDNNAIEIKNTFNLFLPGSAAFMICGQSKNRTAHMFAGIVTKERTILWRGLGGNAPHFEDSKPEYESYFRLMI